MKKIISSILLIFSQVFLGTLVIYLSINSNSIDYKVNNMEINKLLQFEYNDLLNSDSNVVLYSNSIDNSNKEQSNNIEIINVNDNKLNDYNVIESYTGILTGYGPDCVGCGNFITNKVATSSGYEISDIVDGVIQPAHTITYDDYEFGEVRIVAGDNIFPYKTIVRITIPNEEPILAIVLDRGSTVGFSNCRSSMGCLTNFDLLFTTESVAIGKTFNVNFEILRIGG